MIAPNRNQPHDPHAEAMASTPDPYAAIELELAAEDAKLGEWPPPQWWSKQMAREFSQSIGDPPPVNLGTADDPEPLDLGKPWSRSWKLELAAYVVIACGIAALFFWGAGR